MSNKSFRKADAILCADLHLREDTPLCRTDDYMEAQKRKLDWLFELQQKHTRTIDNENKTLCPVLIAGDILHKWDISPKLTKWTIDNLTKNIAIPGQHDLPNHNLDLINDSGFGVLQSSKNIENNTWERIITYRAQVTLFPYGSNLCGAKKSYLRGRDIALIHTLVLGPKDENMKGSTVSEIFKQMPGFDLIVCGDNHQTFVVEENGRLFVSPGSMMRMTADQVDHRPCVYLWYADTNTVEPAHYPIEQGVITREHIDKKQEKDELIDTFVNDTQGGEVSASFEKNMEDYIQENNVRKAVQNKIYGAMRQ